MSKHDGRAATYETGILLNCPFDQSYKPIFDALIVAAFDCIYVPECPSRLMTPVRSEFKRSSRWAIDVASECEITPALSSTPNISFYGRAVWSGKMAACSFQLDDGADALQPPFSVQTVPRHPISSRRMSGTSRKLANCATPWKPCGLQRGISVAAIPAPVRPSL